MIFNRLSKFKPTGGPPTVIPANMSATQRFLNLLTQGADACALSGQHLLLAVSGGADSMALLRGMLEESAPLRLRIRVAHLNHRLRGKASDRDVTWLHETCRQLQVPLTTGEIDVAARAAAEGRSIEETARDLRYEFLSQTAQQSQCTSIAVAHTADDQVETILHHIIRGTGLAGLRGMLPVRDLRSGMRLVRPLLGVTRREVLTYLEAIGQDYREDVSNRNEAFTRNRIRHQLLPLLESTFNPQTREALIRLGQQAAEVHEVLQVVAEDLLNRALADRNQSTVRLNWRELCSQPRHLIRQCFTLIWTQQSWPRQGMGFEQWDRLAEIALQGGSTTLPGNIQARRRDGLLVLRRE